MSEILLVRHGETEWNRLGRFRGRADVPLNQKGLWDADATAQRIANRWDIAAVYSSPVRRALQTAEVIAAATGRTVKRAEDLADVHYGQWEGLTEQQAAARDPEAMKVFLETPSRVRIPGGETFHETQARALNALIRLGGQYAEDVIAVIAHTEVNRLILLAALGGHIDHIWRVGQSTCAINVLRLAGDRIEVINVNDRCHLEE